MASETEMLLGVQASKGLWPPDDSEESVVGTDLHQMTIMNLRWGINEVARSHTAPGQPVPWQALSQTIVFDFVRPDNSRYKTLPDVFVYRRAIDQRRGSLSVAIDGPPVLIVEVLSESTYTVDLDLTAGKGYSYARAGVQEYLALDPTGAVVPERGRAWRLVEGVYRAWEPDGEGRWQSRQIPVAFGLEGALATVYTHAGRRMLREGEIEEELARRDSELARKDAELERLRQLLDERRGEQD